MKWDQTADSADNTQSEETAGLPNTPLRFLWCTTKPHLKWAALASIFAITAAGLGQGSSIFFKWIVDAVEAGDMVLALTFGMLYPVAVLAIQIAYRGSGFTGLQWITRAKKTTYDRLTNYTLGHSHSYFSDRFAGAMLGKVSNVVSAMERFAETYLWTFLDATISILISFLFIIWVDVLSGLVFLALLLALLLFNYWRLPKGRELAHIQAESTTALRGKIVDLFGNASAVRQYSRTPHEMERVAVATDYDRETERRQWTYMETTLVYNSLILFVFSAVMFYLLIQRWQVGDIGTGDFLFVLSLTFQLTGLFVFLGNIMNDLARVFGEAKEGLEDLIVPYEITDQPNAAPLTVTDGAIDWNNVQFRFGDNNHVFRDFTLHIAPGERVGLVGPSGAGKTTFVSLLLRQHDLGGGTIEIDGQNIAEVTQESLRQNIAVVPQEPLLFHRTIRENIAYGKPDATDEEIIAVAQKAQAHDFISTLSDGYDTLVGERGVKLSGGQKQRVAIARAMLKDAPILVLDEATSALDSESEVAIQKALHELMEGKTVIVIAHRLSTLREMDRILVLEAGQIVEDGTHSKLANAGGVYQRLWEHQAGGFLQE